MAMLNTEAKRKLLGTNIAKYRKQKNLSQNQLAELVDVSREHIAKARRLGLNLTIFPPTFIFLFLFYIFFINHKLPLLYRLENRTNLLFLLFFFYYSSLYIFNYFVCIGKTINKFNFIIF